MITRQKRGAIELSMTTIIVIVIGVTLLVLGLSWVRGIFGQVEDLTSQSFEAAEKLIQEQMGSEPFYVSGFTFDIKPGKSKTLYAGIQNFEEDAKFKLDIKVGEQGGSKDWFTLPPSIDILNGDKKGLPIIVKPTDFELGKSYSFTITAFIGEQTYGSQAIIITIAE